MHLALQPDGSELTGDALLRLACINVVMESGSEQDRRQPFEKAQQVYEFVTESGPRKASKSTKK